MLVDGKQFPGSTFYVDTYNTLRSIAGNASRFTEFVPVHFPNMRTIHKLLFLFYTHGLFCFMTGSFVSYLAGFLTFFGLFRFIWFWIITIRSFVRLIFQMGQNVTQHFIIGSFHFEHLQTLQDTCIYRVRLCPFSTIFCFIGIDAA